MAIMDALSLEGLKAQLEQGIAPYPFCAPSLHADGGSADHPPPTAPGGARPVGEL
jgi:hypothetical protein